MQSKTADFSAQLFEILIMTHFALNQPGLPTALLELSQNTEKNISFLNIYSVYNVRLGEDKINQVHVRYVHTCT